MKQVIIVERPPVYERCVKAFGADAIVGQPILWSWGARIYNPMDVDIPPELLAHEAAHGAQQGLEEAEIERWWDKYLSDLKFRLEEEVLGHRAEWFNYVRRRPGKDCSQVLNRIAERLASPLYGSMLSVARARRIILTAA